MAEKTKNVLVRVRKCGRANMIVGITLLGLAGMMTWCFLTYEEEPQVIPAPVIKKIVGCRKMETNPLRECRIDDVNQAVEKYYARLGENADYVENYEDIYLYVKNGQYENTYVVYATYEMKIKDIYTPVPGLGTLYAERSEDGSMKLSGRVGDEIQQYIAEITQHEDVKGLFRQVEEEYAYAVQSDEMLAQVLKGRQRVSTLVLAPGICCFYGEKK